MRSSRNKTPSRMKANSGAFGCSLVLSGGLPAQLDHATFPRVAFCFAGTSRPCPGRLGGGDAWAASRTWLVAKTCASQIFLERRPGGIKLVNHNVAADVSRLKLVSLAQLSECPRKGVIRLTPEATIT